MITIRIDFTAARFHATPWSRHVNEGVAEWPPSPYRLLRALYDVWQRKCPDIASNHVRAALETLASAPPRFTLPPAVATHTRSYLSANQTDPTAKNLVFDPFLVFDRPSACYLTWEEIALDPEVRRALETLLANLNYLGRSESWVSARLWEEAVPDGTVCDVVERSSTSGDLVSVACTLPPAEYQGKPAWADALTFSTANLLKQKISAPPLLKHVRYVLSTEAVQTDPIVRRQPARAQVQAVMLGLDSTVLPLVTATLPVAEQIRVRLMGAHRRRMGDATKISPTFSGKAPDGGKRLDHGHVYILPLAAEDPNRQGRIDRILIVKPDGSFVLDELDAIRGVRQLWQSDGRPDVRCVMTWQGTLADSKQFPNSRVVVSATPFVPPRHWRKGRDPEQYLKSEVARECKNHGFSEPLSVDRTDTRLGPFDVVEYRRNRKDDPVRPGFALRLTFSQPVRTPFTIGYGAHFGLGQFRHHS